MEPTVSRKKSDGYTNLLNVPFEIDNYTHEELVSLADVLGTHLGFIHNYDLLNICGFPVDWAGVNKKGETIAIECGNLSDNSGSYKNSKGRRVARILLTYDKYLHLPYVLSYVPEKSELREEIIKMRDENENTVYEY